MREDDTSVLCKNDISSSFVVHFIFVILRATKKWGFFALAYQPTISFLIIYAAVFVFALNIADLFIFTQFRLYNNIGWMAVLYMWAAVSGLTFNNAYKDLQLTAHVKQNSSY